MRRIIVLPIALAATLALSIAAATFTRSGEPVVPAAYAFPSTGLYLALDCDPASPAIDSSCTIPWNQPINVDVAVVLVNVDVPSANVSAFNFDVVGPQNYLVPYPASGGGGYVDSNPDANQVAFPMLSCNPPPPDPDRDPSPSVMSSFISCFDPVGAASVPAGTQLKLATIHYQSQMTPPSQTVSLALANVNIFNQSPDEILSCNPITEVAGECFGADVNFFIHVFPTNTWTSTPTPIFTPTVTPTPTGITSNDSDQDGLFDINDNCPNTPNSDQANHDINRIDLDAWGKAFDDFTRVYSDSADAGFFSLGDACDPDDDNDGLPDVAEADGSACNGAITQQFEPDSDGDLYLDGAECARNTNPLDAASKPQITQCGGTTDADGDRLPARVESCFYNTRSDTADTDADACMDGREAATVNEDRVVNAIDLGFVAAAFGMSTARGYVPDFDLNKDANINALDLGSVAALFGPCSP
jgi:hypothetical protein